MKKLYDFIREEFIKATNGEFLNWSEAEQEEYIQRVAAKQDMKYWE